MEMMKAVVYEKPGRANGLVKLVPKPVCGDNDVLMKVMSCAICKPAESSHDRETGSLICGKDGYPTTPGHEFAGIAVEVGKNVTTVKIGDRITADNAYPCGHCYNCKTGHPAMCENYRCQGHNMPGGFSQYLLCAEEKVFPFSESVSYDKACMTELCNCCEAAVKAAELKYDDSVVVLGCGSSGNLVAQMCRTAGTGRVAAVDVVQSKLERIKDYGVETILGNKDDFSVTEAAIKEKFPNGVDVIIDCVGDSAALLEPSMKLLAPSGRLVVYSFFYFEPKTFKVDPGLMIRQGLKITSAPLQMGNFGNIIKHMEHNLVDTSAVIDAIYPIEDYFKALDQVMNDPKTMKVIIHPNEG